VYGILVVTSGTFCDTKMEQKMPSLIWDESNNSAYLAVFFMTQKLSLTELQINVKAAYIALLNETDKKK